ncbi:ribonuclease H1 [Tiliqua scincoides]|uniref:ribonuclease H1 n=1 Tax=Tiliqua scincoides TaxID=71010 RepID=UPI003461A847
MLRACAGCRLRVSEAGAGLAAVMLRQVLALLSPPCFVPCSGGRGGNSMFYAVRKGRQVGVFRSWEDCKKQVDKYQYASFKKFKSEDDAWDFVNSRATVSSYNSSGISDVAEERQSNNSNQDTSWSYHSSYKRPCEQSSENQSARKHVKYNEMPSASSQKENEFSYMGEHVVVYTDGCCSSNGRYKARAGTGVYWGPNHPLNSSDRLPGRQTNQRAEIHAACKAIEQAKSQNIKKLAIYTDSKFTINGITNWVENWKTNGWKTSTKKDVINREDFERLAELSEGMDIHWMHVPGHSGFTGNEAADRLAREGAGKTQC